MAGYSIVLNLSGNAVSQTEKLAANLSLAATNAALLSARLAEVGAAARAIPARPIRVGKASSVPSGAAPKGMPRQGMTYIQPKGKGVTPTTTARNLVQSSEKVLPGRVVKPSTLQRARVRPETVIAQRPDASYAAMRNVVANLTRKQTATDALDRVAKSIKPTGVTPTVTPPRVNAPAPRAPYVTRAALDASRTRPASIDRFVRPIQQPSGLSRAEIAARKAAASARDKAQTLADRAARVQTVAAERANRARQAATERAARAQAAAANRAARQAEQASRQEERRRTRHKSTRVASFGYGASIGGFSGRLSTILQADENGKIGGIDAGKLSKALNVGAIATNAAASIGKALLKVTAYSTVAPIVLGGGVIMTAINALQSESFAEGVRLISRKHQAKKGLGADYEQAQTNADYLASSYGFDRSTTVSSINVMTGLGVNTGVEGKKRKLSLGEATGLTKVGGLISQHHGVPFERVMTNIQQLLVQDKPNLRDIRELLNQAPILGKYALREMEKKGSKETDVRSYLKNPKNILSVLKSYELDTATNAGMQARGQIGLAKQDAWAKVAGNDPFWRMVGDSGSGIIGALATGINGLMTTLANSQEFRVMVKNIEIMFDRFGEKGDTFIDKLIKLVDAVAAKYGLDFGDKPKAKLETDRDKALVTAMSDPKVRERMRSEWEKSGLPVSSVPEERNREFTSWLDNEATRYVKNDAFLRDRVGSYGKFKSESDLPWFERIARSVLPDQISPFNQGMTSEVSTVGYGTNARTTVRSVAGGDTGVGAVPKGLATDDKRFIFRPNITNWSEPSSANAAYTVPIDLLTESVKDFIKEQKKIQTGFGDDLNKGETGEDIKQSNKDRRSLEIHFHDKLVEWNNTVMTGNPKEVTEEVAENMDLIVSAAIQRALLGASNKVAASWY